jgi:hypothetical protein
MSTLVEKPAKPLLFAMIKDGKLRMEPSAQQAVATWLTMKAMVLEWGDDRPIFRYFHQAERDAMRERQEIPDHARVWLARHKSYLTPQGTARRLESIFRRAAVPTVVFGHLVVQGLFIRSLGTSNTLQYPRALTNPNWWTVEVWPLPGEQAPKDWPPKQSLDERSLGPFANRWDETKWPNGWSPADQVNPPSEGGTN